MNWIGAKQHPTQFATSKNAPGIDYAHIYDRVPEVDTRFGYTTDMVKTYKEVTDEPTPTA